MTVTVAPTCREFHEVANIFPMMGDEEYQRLVVSIKMNGLREPIWTYQDKIIDGRNRYKACLDAGIEPRYREWSGNGSLVLFVVDLNLERRHLTSSQKAMSALEIEQQLAREAENRTGGRPSKIEMIRAKNASDAKPGTILSQVSHQMPVVQTKAANQAGAMVGASGTYVKEAKKIVEQAPELKEPVLSGTLTIPEAKVVAKLPELQRREVVNRVASGKAKTAKAAILDIKMTERDAQAQVSPSKPVLAHASWKAWLPQQSPCDLLITDPPYSTDIEDVDTFAHDWLPLALSKVKTSGRAYVCIGAYPHELRAYLNVPVPAHLRLLQVLVWTYKNTLGPSPVNTYKQNWQAILYYIGLNAPRLDCPLMNEQFSVQEINAPDGRLGDRYHTWQKPDELARRLIQHSTKPGDTVLDCFAGTGTFVLAAHRLGRVARGCDISREMLEIAQVRGCEVGYAGNSGA
jgi:16S rRNA G966 N2-methylase RsmD